MNLLKIDINLLNDNARKLFEYSNVYVLNALFNGCMSIDDINKTADDLFSSALFDEE